MSKKTERLDVIRNLIDSEQISSQEELLSWLKRVGIDATQSTLSRDMKELRAIKVPDAEKGYVYLLPDTAGRTDLGQGLLIGDGQHQVHRVFGQYDCHTHEGRLCESRGGDG